MPMFIPTKNDIKTITDLRENTLALLKNVQKKQGATVIFHRNSPKVVMLSIDRYNQLMSLLEDYIDGELARELEKRPKKKEDYIPFEKVVKELKISL